MRRHSRPGRRRWVVSGLTVAGLLTSATAGVAQADDTQAPGTPAPIPVSITGPDHHDLSLEEGFPAEGEPSFEVWAEAEEPSTTDEDGVTYPVYSGDFTLTIDATGVADIANVEFAGSDDCDVDGPVAVCSGWEIYGSGHYNERFGVRLAAQADSEGGETGSIVVTGEAEGVDFTSHTVNVLAGGPEFEERKLSEPEGFEASQVYKAPLAFRNAGAVAAQGVQLRFSGSRGLTFPQKFSNCSYAVENQDNLIAMRRVAVCTFEGTFEPGTVYQVATPVKVKTAEFALRDTFVYHFSALDREPIRQGNGKRLTLKTVSGENAEFTGWSALGFPTGNTFDLDLTGDRAKGAEGETVTVDLALHNYGPAWRAHLRSGGEPLSFTVDIPEGTSVTAAPDNCSPRGQEEPAKSYFCFADTPLLEKDKREYTFELRIDKVIEGAKGLLSLGSGTHPNEGDPSNDDGWIVLNGTGDEETPGDTGGQGGSDGSDGTDGTDGSDDASGDDDGASASGGSGGGDGDGSDSGTDTDGGSLALTGTGAMTLGGVALALLAAGGGLIVVRRRRAAEPVTVTDDAAA